MTTYRVTLEYDGTAFRGWQWQPSVPTVEGAVREALAQLTGERPRFTAAGRTDAGAHSHGQVIGFTLECDRLPDTLLTGLNATLPADIVVRDVAVASPEFHARFNAVDRTYRYVVSARRARRAVGRQFAWSVRGPLDLGAMREAGSLLVGHHNFAGFGRSSRAGGTTDRTVLALQIRSVRAARADGADVVLIDVRADAFLYGMMRSIAGVLVAVGEGRASTADVEALLRQPHRVSSTFAVAPAHGLHQMAVSYPGGPEGHSVLVESR